MILWASVLAGVLFLIMGAKTVFANAQDLGELKIDLQSGTAILASETVYYDLTTTLAGFTETDTLSFMAEEAYCVSDLDYDGFDDIILSKNAATGNYEVKTTSDCSISGTFPLKTPDVIRQFITNEGFERYYGTLTFIFPKAPEASAAGTSGKTQTTATSGSSTSGKSKSTAAKKANPMKVKAKTAALKYKKLKTRKQTIAAKNAVAVSKAKGKVTYKLVSVTKKSFKKYFTVQKKTGKITVKKGLKKGTYKLKIKVTAAGNSSYKSLSKTVTCKIRVK